MEAFVSKVDVMIYFLGISQPLSPATECSLSRFMKLVALAGGGGGGRGKGSEAWAQNTGMSSAGRVSNFSAPVIFPKCQHGAVPTGAASLLVAGESHWILSVIEEVAIHPRRNKHFLRIWITFAFLPPLPPLT